VKRLTLKAPKNLAPTLAPRKNTTSKNTVQHASRLAPHQNPLGGGDLVQVGSTVWSGRVIFARDLEPIVTRLEPSPTGPRLVIESETFGAILPASPFILSLLARKLENTAKA
jgi:hypothetical protein